MYYHPQLLIMKECYNSTDGISHSNTLSSISLQNKPIPLALIDCTFVIHRYESQLAS